MGILYIRHPRNPCWNTHIYYCLLLSRMYFLLFKGWRWAFFISGIPGILLNTHIYYSVLLSRMYFLLFKGWRWAFFISGIPGILVGILIFITVFCCLECIFFCSRVGDGHSLYQASQESLLEYSYLLQCFVV